METRQETTEDLERGDMVYYLDDQDCWRRGAYLNEVFGGKVVKVRNSFFDTEEFVDPRDVRGLSKNQKEFVESAKMAGLEVDYDYSGRYMFGKRCPAVTVSRPGDFQTEAKTMYDQMGLEYVIYARE